jgi:hypothetical protein
MSKIVHRWTFTGWLITAPVILTTLLALSKFQPEQLYNSIKAINADELNSGRLLDRLPEVFPIEPGISFILLIDSERNFQGGIYEPGRIEPQIYRHIVNKLQLTKFAPENSGALLQNFQLSMLRYTLSDDRVLLLAVKKNQGLLQSWLRLSHDIPFLPWIIILYSLISLTWYFYMEPLSSSQLKTTRKTRIFRLENLPSMRFRTGKRKKPMVKLSPNTEPETQGEHILFENQLQQFLNEADRIVRSKRLVFFFKENNNWKPEREKVGQLLVKSDERFNLEHFWPVFAAHEEWKEPLHSVDGNRSLFPVRRREQITGCLLVEKHSPERITKREIESLMPVCESFARSLYIQKTYERAVLDPETGFYTYPYFLFSLKERLVSGRSFMILSFELKKFQELEAELALRFARVCQLEKTEFFEETQATLCRLDSNRFACIIDDSNAKMIKKATMFGESLIENAAQVTHERLTGSLLSPGKGSPNVDQVLRWVQQSIQASRETTKIQPFIPDTLRAVS